MIVDSTLKDIFPWIDDRVSTMSSSNIRDLTKLMVGVHDGKAVLIHKNHKPLAVVVSYETYLKIQEAIKQ